jgi:Fur family transcriptional regulator, peroxide stress response regulator
LEYLHRKENHPTAIEIYSFLSPEIPSLSKTTIYNILNTFVEAGLIRTLGIEDNEMRYDLLLSNHGHFRCEVCGEITNFAIDIDRFPLEGLDQYQIKEKNVYFKGLCPNCSKLKRVRKD